MVALLLTFMQTLMTAVWLPIHRFWEGCPIHLNRWFWSAEIFKPVRLKTLVFQNRRQEPSTSVFSIIRSLWMDFGKQECRVSGIPDTSQEMVQVWSWNPQRWLSPCERVSLSSGSVVTSTSGRYPHRPGWSCPVRYPADLIWKSYLSSSAAATPVWSLWY